MKNNISAFPCYTIMHDVSTGKFAGLGTKSDGMSLRDYFAGQALAGLTVNYATQSIDIINTECVVRQCYKFADAMLAEREKK